MKFLVCLVGICSIVCAVYWFLGLYFRKTKKQRQKKTSRKIIGISVFVALALLGFLAFAMYQSAIAPDTQCSNNHVTTTRPPEILITAQDYFNFGNYDYDIGNCPLAIIQYSKAISIDSTYVQAYNNRAYTYMRMRQYDKALSDLNTAIVLKPEYIQALMNRGDIHNYYYNIDRSDAMIDYQKVISLGGEKNTSVCGHLFLARHNGWNIWTILSLPEVFIDHTCR